jgi:hypothetical protein
MARQSVEEGWGRIFARHATCWSRPDRSIFFFTRDAIVRTSAACTILRSPYKYGDDCRLLSTQYGVIHLHFSVSSGASRLTEESQNMESESYPCMNGGLAFLICKMPAVSKQPPIDGRVVPHRVQNACTSYPVPMTHGLYKRALVSLQLYCFCWVPNWVRSTKFLWCAVDKVWILFWGPTSQSTKVVWCTLRLFN